MFTSYNSREKNDIHPHMAAKLADRKDLDALQAECSRLQKRIDELEKIEERYKLAMDGANEGLWEWNPVNKNLLISSRLMATLGHENASLRTTTHQWLEWVHPDDIERYEKMVTRHLKGQSEYFECEYRVKATDGIYHWVFARGKALRNADGIAYRMVGSVGDITDRKLAEQKLKNAYGELESRIAERTQTLVNVNKQLNREVQERRQIEKELNIAKDIAVQANLSKDKYLAAASHDLLQPLNAARLLVSTLQERKLKQDNLVLVNRVHNALNNAEELLSDLLDIAKLDAHAIPHEVIQTPVNTLIETLKDEFESVAKKEKVSLRVRPCCYGVQTDPHLLRRVLRNFLSNAIRYSHGGRVLLGCRKRGELLRIQVWDSGPGIPKDKFDEIFLEFKQLQEDIPATGTNKGVGLGLAIVERIASMLDHPIHVQSIVGKGSVFSIDVPLCKIPPAIDRPKTQDGNIFQNNLQGMHILVIDNEGSITHSMADLLKEWGAHAHCALSKSAALSEMKFSDHTPSVILADYHLDQEENGIDVIEAIHEQHGHHIPAVIITADRSQKVNRQCKASGYHLLNKPLKPAKLKALLYHFQTAQSRN